MTLRWQSFAEQVCDIASRIYGQTYSREVVGGVAVDGILNIAPDYSVAVMAALEIDDGKLLHKCKQLHAIKSRFASRDVFLKSFVVTRGDASEEAAAQAEKLGIVLVSVSGFATSLINYDQYHQRRIHYPFGSAVDPQSGEIDRVSYIPVSYLDRATSRQYGTSEIVTELYAGKIVVLFGEYGSGKSRCISEVFSALAAQWGDTLELPFAINLRECWGMQTAEELVRRHMHLLRLDGLANSAVRVLDRSSGIYLLDGFDEVGSQAWSVDEAKLRSLRAQALSGVRDIVGRSKKGCLIAGREHYFSSRDEMISALGVDEKSCIILHVHEEFTIEQMEEYFDAAQINVSLPQWLPRRPLICQTISQLDSDEISRMFSEESKEAEFWNHFIEIVCKRDARINPSFDDATILQVYIELARKSRVKPMNVGPFNQRDLQDAFEAAVGQPPTDEASVMLQRLPSLGRIGAESTDRQFIDMYILDGLRGRDIARIPELSEDRRRSTLEEQWMNPLGVLGYRVLAEFASERLDTFKSLLKRASESRNAVAASDIVSALFHTNNEAVDFGRTEIIGGLFGTLDFTLSEASNLSIRDSVIETLILPTSPPRQTEISRTSVGTVRGAAAMSGLPGWTKLESVDEFDSIQTVARIRNAGLTPAQEVLAAIIKKTFFQKGAGRKEEALLRGFGTGASQKIASRILNLLLREDILTSFKGDEGKVYAPNRSEAGRMDVMLKELRSSSDDIWLKVSQL